MWDHRQQHKMVPVSQYHLWFKFTSTHIGYFCFHVCLFHIIVTLSKKCKFTALCTQQLQSVQTKMQSLYPSLRATKYCPTKIRRNKTSCHLNSKRLHPAFNKPQIPKSIWIKVFDYQFPSNPRPWPSVASAGRRVGRRCSQQGGIPPPFPSLKLVQSPLFYSKWKRKTQKGTICSICKTHHKYYFPECILFNNSAADRRKKWNIDTDKCPALFHAGPGRTAYFS